MTSTAAFCVREDDKALSSRSKPHKDGPQQEDLKSGVVLDFDQIYSDAIKPAIEECELKATTTAASEEMVHQLKGRGRRTINFGSQRVGVS